MLFENFKKNNIEGNLIKLEDIIECIEKNGFIYASIVNNLKNHDRTSINSEFKYL